MVKSKKDKKNLIWWIVGIFYILLGIGAFSDSVFGGVLMILGGVLVTPYFDNILKEKNIEIKTGAKIIFLVVLLVIIASIGGTTNDLDNSVNVENNSNYDSNIGIENTSNEADVETIETNKGEPIEEENYEAKLDDKTLGEKNALSQAKSYLDVSAFSYSGLIEQLEFEGYTHEEAVYGVDNCGADWNKQAALSAQSYLDIMAFSRQELIEQLEFEGYTSEQAEYGVEAVGY